LTGVVLVKFLPFTDSALSFNHCRLENNGQSTQACLP
jgi:hypothetical protein